MKQHHILIVEDEDDIREVLQGFFESEGLAVSSVPNGYEAIRFLKMASAKPDVILLDLMMPVMNGQEFLKSIKAVQNFVDIPVVIMSADNQTAEKAKALGEDKFIKKPLDLNQLLSLIQGIGSTADEGINKR